MPFFFRLQQKFLPKGLIHPLKFLFQLSGRDETASLAQNDNLFHPVGGGHRHVEAAGVFVGEFFNILIRRFCLSGKHHLNIVVGADLCRMALHPVSVEYDHKRALADRLIIAEHVQERHSGSVQIVLCQSLQPLPGKDHVIAVYQQIFLLFSGWLQGGSDRLRRRFFREAALFSDAGGVFFPGRILSAAVGIKGSLKDSVDFLRTHPHLLGRFLSCAGTWIFKAPGCPSCFSSSQSRCRPLSTCIYALA